MKGWKRLLYYVLINIVVSAATTLVVLKVWERTHPPLAEVITPTPVSTPSQTAALATSAPAAGVTEQAAAPTDALLPSETPRPAPTLELIEYKIKSGDTLGSIAVEFDISMAECPFPDRRIKRKPIYSSAGCIHQHSGRAIYHITGCDLLVTRLQKIFKGYWRSDR